MIPDFDTNDDHENGDSGDHGDDHGETHSTDGDDFFQNLSDWMHGVAWRDFEAGKPSCRLVPALPETGGERDDDQRDDDLDDWQRSPYGPNGFLDSTGVCAMPCAGACNCGTRTITVGSTWFTEVPGVVSKCDVYDEWDPRSCDAILEDVSRYTWAQFVLCCCITVSSLVLAGTLILVHLSQPRESLSALSCARQACGRCIGLGSTPPRSDIDTEAGESGVEIGSLHPACGYVPPVAASITAEDRISLYRGTGLPAIVEGYVGSESSVSSRDDNEQGSLASNYNEQGLLASNV